MISWIRKRLASAKLRGEDPDRYWREWHIARRERRLDYYRKKREQLLISLESTEACIAYYEDKLDVLK